MKIIDTTISDVKLITPERYDDERGFFMQTWHSDQYRDAGISIDFVQDNWSRSFKGALRGLHYQLKSPQSKLIWVTCGEVFDVAVDIRRGSPSFGKWVGQIISESNCNQIFIPEGFAHGFLVLSDVADMVYKCGSFYMPGDEYGICWNDQGIGIEWPLEDMDILLSEKDGQLPLLADVKTSHLSEWKEKVN